MPSRLQRRDTVIAKAARSAEHDDVAMLENDALHLILALLPAEQKGRRHAERHGDDRLAEVALVLILMQREARARLVTIDEARIGREAGESRGVDARTAGRSE